MKKVDAFFRSFANLPPTDSKIVAAGKVSNAVKNVHDFAQSCKAVTENDEVINLAKALKEDPDTCNKMHSDVLAIVTNVAKVMKDKPQLDSAAVNYLDLTNQMKTAVQTCALSIETSIVLPLVEWSERVWKRFACSLAHRLGNLKTNGRSNLGGVKEAVSEKVAAFAEEFEPVSQNVLSMIGMLSAVTKADRVSTTDFDKHVLLGNQGLETVKLMQAIMKLEENLTDGQLTDQGMSHAMQALAKSCKSMNKLKDAASKDADETSGLSIMFKVFDKSLCKWLLDVVVQSTAPLRRQFEDSVFACKYLQDSCW